MGLILDSDVLISSERRRFDLPAFLSANGKEHLFIAAVTASELLHGVERATAKWKESRSLFVERVLSTIETIDFDIHVARRHATIWAKLEASGKLIGAHDIQIAATALHHGHGLVTLNTREFERVAGLHLPDPRPYVLTEGVNPS